MLTNVARLTRMTAFSHVCLYARFVLTSRPGACREPEWATFTTFGALGERILSFRRIGSKGPKFRTHDFLDLLLSLQRHLWVAAYFPRGLGFMIVCRLAYYVASIIVDVRNHPLWDDARVQTSLLRAARSFELLHDTPDEMMRWFLTIFRGCELIVVCVSRALKAGDIHPDEIQMFLRCLTEHFSSYQSIPYFSPKALQSQLRLCSTTLMLSCALFGHKIRAGEGILLAALRSIARQLCRQLNLKFKQNPSLHSRLLPSSFYEGDTLPLPVLGSAELNLLMASVVKVIITRVARTPSQREGTLIAGIALCLAVDPTKAPNPSVSLLHHASEYLKLFRAVAELEPALCRHSLLHTQLHSTCSTIVRTLRETRFFQDPCTRNLPFFLLKRRKRDDNHDDSQDLCRSLSYLLSLISTGFAPHILHQAVCCVVHASAGQRNCIQLSDLRLVCGLSALSAFVAAPHFILFLTHFPWNHQQLIEMTTDWLHARRLAVGAESSSLVRRNSFQQVFCAASRLLPMLASRKWPADLSLLTSRRRTFLRVAAILVTKRLLPDTKETKIWANGCDHWLHSAVILEKLTCVE